MPKLKTNKSVAKRVRITKTGKLKRKKAGASHILTKKSRKKKRQMRRAAIINKTQTAILKKLIPYR